MAQSIILSFIWSRDLTWARTPRERHDTEDDMPHFPASQRYSLPYRAIEIRRERQIKLAAGVSTSGQPHVALAPRSPANPGFGAQAGDPRRGVDMDLSTCVNRYGPAPAAVAALHSIPAAEMLMHPRFKGSSTAHQATRVAAIP